MSHDEIQERLDQASRHYNDGRYDEAAKVWKSVLQEDPENERAREGLQMVELLTQDFGAPPAAGGAPTGADAAQVQEAVQRVQELLDSGDAEAAREGVEVLLQIAPDDPQVQQCAARLEAGGDPAAYVAEQLSLARHYAMMEEPAAAVEACRRALSMDPANDEAKELMQQARGGEEPAPGPPAATSEPVAEAPPVDQPLGDDDLLTFDLDSLEDAGDSSPSPDLELLEAPEPADSAEDAGERIAKLLVEGDEMEAQGDLQGAVQVWSRVFILQDSNAEAEERVERARRALEEQALRADEIRFRAEDLMAAGNLTEARDEYNKVLEILPNHQEAKGALEQIEKILAGGGADEQSEEEDIEAVPLSLPEQPQEAASEELDLEDEPFLESPPPTPPPAPEVVIPAAAPARSGPGRGLILSVLVVGVLVLGAAGYVGWNMLFPSGPSGELQALEPQPLDRTSAGPAGVGTPDPAPEEPAAAVPEAVPVAPSKQAVLDDEEAAVLAKQVVEEGARLFDSGEYAQALEQYRRALDLDPGNMDAKDGETSAALEVSKWEVFEREVATIRAAVADFDYESALKKLYRMEPPAEDEAAMAHRWIVACWYNWGVLRLQAARLREAEEKFQEVLDLEAGDEEAANHLEVVRRYRSRPVDATFKNYTSRLTLRELD